MTGMTQAAGMRIALVGIGKIALDQHVPALADSPAWDLAATVSRHGRVEGVPSFPRIEDMLEARPDIGAGTSRAKGRPTAKDGAAHAHQRAALGHGRFQVGAHPHGQRIQRQAGGIQLVKNGSGAGVQGASSYEI